MATVPAGSLLMNRGGNPTILNNTGSVLVSPTPVAAMTSADRMSTLDSGEIINVTTSGIEIFTPALALGGSDSPGGSTRGSSALLAGSLLYGATKSGGQTNLLTYSTAGVLLSTSTIVISGTLYRSIAMAPDGVTVYFAENGGDEVWVKTIGGGAASVLVDFLALGWFVNCLQNLRDGRIAVGLQKDGDPDGPGRVTILNPDGTIDIDIDIDFQATYLAIDTTDAHLWVGMYVKPGSTIWRMTRLDTSTGAVTNTFDLAVSGNWDYPFVVLQRSLVDTPIPTPNPTPAAPQTDCTPTAEVSGGGIGNSGCSVGGVGFVSGYSGPYGAVPVRSDPSDGGTLAGKVQVDLWVEHVHTDYPSGTVTTYRRSFKELGDSSTYEGGRKPAGLKTIGELEHGLGNEQGRFEPANVDIHYADQVDRLYRILLDTQDVEGDEIRIKAATPEARAAAEDPIVLMRAIVTAPKTTNPMDASITAVDALFSDYGPYGPMSKYPPYKFKDLGNGAPYLPSDIADKPIPILYSEKSDEGATDPLTGAAVNPKGLNPGYFIGRYNLPSDIITVTPTTGRSFEELVAAFEASGAAGTLVVDFAADFGVEMADLQALYDAGGGIPDYLTGLAAGVGVDKLGTEFNGVGYSDIAEWQAGGDTTNTPGSWGLIVFGLRPWFRRYNYYASDLGGGNPDKKHDRVVLSGLAGREDVLAPDYNWPFTNKYVEILNSETGKRFWLEAIWVRGPLLDDHINGDVNFTLNAIGNEDVGDGTGLPIMAIHDVEQDWLDNFVLPDVPWSSGPLADDVTYPTFKDGTPKVRTTSFASRQAYTVTKVGDIGLRAGWWAGEQQKSNLEWIYEWNFSTETKLGIDHHGQTFIWGLDDTVDPSSWPAVRHVTDLFGRITRSSGEDRENVVVGTCDLDPDGQKQRVGPITKRSAYGIGMYKGREKQGRQLDSTIISVQSQWEWVLSQRVIRLQVGITLYDVDGRIQLLDNKVSEGILLTTIEGTGASGFVGRPMYITRNRLSFTNRIASQTLWDVQNVLIATRFPNGLERISTVTDGSGPTPVTDTADMTALVMD